MTADQVQPVDRLEMKSSDVKPSKSICDESTEIFLHNFDKLYYQFNSNCIVLA